jgi:hypothetical protein
VTKAEARRRICAGAAVLLDNGSRNAWLYEGDGGALCESDQRLMRDAFDELVSELQKRAGGVRPDRARVTSPSIKQELERLQMIQVALNGAFPRRPK